VLRAFKSSLIAALAGADPVFSFKSALAALSMFLLTGSANAQRDSTKAAQIATPVVTFAQLTKAQWREDMQFLARELPKRHANAFHHTARERFEAGVSDLDRRLDSLNADEIYIGLDRIANLVGDAHTYVEFPDDTADLPLQIKQFGDEYRVTGVVAGMEKALGARIVRIHETPIARARELLLTMTPQDETPFLAQARVESFLTLGIVLHGYGIIPDRSTASFTLAEDGGHEFAVEARALAANAKPKWIPVYKEPPLFRQKPGEAFWCTYLPDARTVYCSFRGYNGLGKLCAGLFKLIAEQQPDKLVIDMRQNGGGDFMAGLGYLIRPIRKLPNINNKGHLFVLVGAHTFSAAMSNAAHFRDQTAALLVGQPIGEKPNSYQESRRIKLPNSRLNLCYSVRFYKFVAEGENLIRPDQEIIPSWIEFKEGRDPVLEWVLKQETK
jgi:hypothetical protein